MAKRIKAAFECKKQAGAVNGSLRFIFYLREEHFTGEDHVECDVFSCNSQSKRKLKNRTGAEKTKKRPVGMGKWEILGKDFFYIPLWLRSSDDQTFSGQC